MEVRKQKVRKLLAILMAEKMRNTQARQKEQFKQSDEFMSLFKDEVPTTTNDTMAKLCMSPKQLQTPNVSKPNLMCFPTVN